MERNCARVIITSGHCALRFGAKLALNVHFHMFNTDTMQYQDFDLHALLLLLSPAQEKEKYCSCWLFPV